MADALGHAGHDPMHVAAALDRGARLTPLLQACLRCAALYADLLTVAGALPLTAAPARSRDFRLSAHDAIRLRPGRWRGWWSAFGTARDAVTRPLAVGLTTVGLAGLLLTAVPTFLPIAGSGAAPASAEGQTDTTFRITAGPSAAPAPPDVPPAPVEIVSPLVPWLGLLAMGGGLFAARRVAARGRPVR